MSVRFASSADEVAALYQQVGFRESSCATLYGSGPLDQSD